MEKKKLQGVWIPLEILKNENLSDKEKILYSIILGLSIETGYCYATNRYFGNILNITKGRISKLISSLKDKGFIKEKLMYEEGSKKIDRRELRPMVIFNHTHSRKEPYSMAKKNQDIINNIIYSINNKKNYRNYAQRQYSDEEWEDLYANDLKNKEEWKNSINIIKINKSYAPELNLGHFLG